MPTINLEEKRETICRIFCHYFLIRLNPNYNAWEDLRCKIENHLEYDERDELSRLVLSSLEKSSKFPVSRSYVRDVFTKTGLRLKEPTSLCIVGKDEDGDYNYAFKSYVGDVTLIEENLNKMGRDTTGLISWQGAGLILEWADAFGANELHGRNVIELGSGLGLMGLSLFKNSSIGIKSYTCTDCHPKVLNFLVNNAKINLRLEYTNNLSSWLSDGPPIEIDTYDFENTNVNEGNFYIRHLDWTNYEESDIPDDVDVVLGSDIVYDPGLLSGLCAVIESFFKKGARVAYIACTQRSFEGIEAFLRALRERGLRSDVAYKRTFAGDDSFLMTHEPFKPIILYKIITNQ